MLLTITYEGQNAPNLGYLLYKNPYRPQVFTLNFGKAYVFYPEVSEERTTVAMLLDIDPIDLVRGKKEYHSRTKTPGLFDYVNDRPYVSSSFMSTAISKIFGTAITGRADDHQELSDSSLSLTATISMLPCRTGQERLKSIFEPLGYEVDFESFIYDEIFAYWGESKYVNLTLKGKVRLRDMLKHLYVLIPVFDRQKHYWMGEDEVEKLLRMGEDWLPSHPEKVYITGRYLYRRRSLASKALALLNENASLELEESDKLDREPTLNAQRLDIIAAVLKNSGAEKVLDLGCGEGNLLKILIKEKQFTKITGVDISPVSLERAAVKLKLDMENPRMQLIQGSLTYKDSRFSGYDAAALIEVVEHIDIQRLYAFEQVLFEFARPRMIVLTTPNKEYNVNYKTLSECDLRHSDHRFEWTRDEFRNWALDTAKRFGYTVQFASIGDIDEQLGAPTQMGVFTLCE